MSAGGLKLHNDTTGEYMKRITLLLIILLLLTVQLGAKHSDDFLIGTYSYILNPFPFFTEHRELLARYLQDMGYNSNILETNINDRDLPGLLETLDRHGIDAWIIDKGYSNDPKNIHHYVVTPLSTSSYQRFEAEYESEKSVHSGDDTDSEYWYASRNYSKLPRVGRSEKYSGASNDYVWRVLRKKDQAGYVMGDLSYRWPNFNGYNVRIGQEFHFYTNNRPGFEGEYIWLTYRFKISNVAPETSVDDTLVSFQVAGYPLSPTGFAPNAKQVQTISHIGNTDELKISYRDYIESKDKDGFMEYTLQVPYQALMDAGLLERLGSSMLYLANLNPRMYWSAKCDLDLDYVELRDQISHELSTMEPAFKKAILDRAKAVIGMGKGNVSGFYSFDEPYQGQFDSYRLMEEILAEEGIDMLTACYDYRDSYFRADRDPSFRYNHLDSFLKQVKPKFYCPDIYPLQPQYAFNPGSADKEFIQDVLDRKLLTVYENGIRYKLQDPKRKFYPIVQAFARWSKSDPDSWGTWILPPYATQKALLYLPLVYGADGVIHYRMMAMRDADGYGDFTALNTYLSEGQYVKPFVNSITRDAILHTNPKVKAYGETIQNLHWVGAQRVMTPIKKMTAAPASSWISGLYTDLQAEAPYSGFIQVGHYLDNDDNPWLMVVNRRGDYFRPAELDDEDLVHPDNYDEYFRQADPQTLHIEFKDSAKKGLGKYLGLRDPYTNELIAVDNKQRADIELPAGEAGLYQVFQTLPPTLNESIILNGVTAIYGEVVLGKKANLKLDKNSKLILSPGSKLLVSPEARITMAGNIELQGDAQMQILGYLKDKNPKITKAEDALYIDQSKAPRSFFKRLFGIK